MIATELLVELAVKSLAIALLGLLLLRLVRGRSAAQRSLVAHLTLAALVMLPVATLALPDWSPIRVPSAPVAVGSSAIDAPAAVAEPGMSNPIAATTAPEALRLPVGTIMSYAYLLPLMLLIGAMLVAIVRLFTMRARATVLVQPHWLVALAEAQRRMGFKHGTALLVSDEVRSPISWGVMRPTIVLDPQAAESAVEAEAIIAHELAHVARLDWAKLLIARLACALFWFNPLVWMLARESHQLREEAADDAVLLAQIDDAHYASLLVNAARHDNGAILLAAHGVAPSRDSLKRRVTRILDRGLARGPAGATLTALGTIAVIGIVGPVGALSPNARAEAPVAGSLATAPAPAESVRRAARISTQETTTTRFDADTLVAMRATGVTPADVEAAQKTQGRVNAEDVIAAKAVGIDPENAARLAAEIGTDSLSDLTAARAVGVDAAYARAMRTVFPGIDADDLVGARAIGVTAEYAAAIRRDIPAADLSDIVGMRAVGITGDYVRAMRQAGIDMSDPDVVIGQAAIAGPPGARAIARGGPSAQRRSRAPSVEPPAPPGRD